MKDSVEHGEADPSEGGMAVETNITAYLQWVRENDPQSPGLGAVGGEVIRLRRLTDEQTSGLNREHHALEIKRALKAIMNTEA
jgi:hypothetical protein